MIKHILKALVKLAAKSIGKCEVLDNSKSIKILKLNYRPISESVYETCEFLIQNGFVKPKTNKNSLQKLFVVATVAAGLYGAYHFKVHEKIKTFNTKNKK